MTLSNQYLFLATHLATRTTSAHGLRKKVTLIKQNQLKIPTSKTSSRLENLLQAASTTQWLIRRAVHWILERIRLSVSLNSDLKKIISYNWKFGHKFFRTTKCQRMQNSSWLARCVAMMTRELSMTWRSKQKIWRFRTELNLWSTSPEIRYMRYLHKLRWLCIPCTKNTSASPSSN